MLKLPAIKKYDDVTVFPDDTRFWVFYLIPERPRLRLDAAGNPVFLLIKYLFSDQGREDDPDLPRGGGYLTFDAELGISDERRLEIEADLQKLVQAEYDRLKALPPSRSRTLSLAATFNDPIGGHWAGRGHHGTPRAGASTGSAITLAMPSTDETRPEYLTNPPKVVIGEPIWKSGKVWLETVADKALVSAKSEAQPAALIGDNVASFSLSLTPEGATFMERTLVNPDGSGGTDLTPISVKFDLELVAKLPPAKVYARVVTKDVYHSCQELFHEHDSSGCDDDYFTSETMMASAIHAGMVDIKIDTGGITDEDLVQMLNQQAQKFVTDTMASVLAKKEPPPLEEWANEDVQNSGNEIYRLKRQTEVDMTDVVLNQTLASSTTFKIAPGGALETFFHKRTDMSRFIRVVDLNDKFFQTLDLTCQVFANWATDGIAAVELEIKYEHGRELKTQSFTFTPEDHARKKWDPSLMGGSRKYTFRHRVTFAGRAAGEWTAWTTATSRTLNVAVETPGKLAVEVTGVGIDFANVVDAVLVHLRYGDPQRDIEVTQTTVLLTAERGSGTWERMLYVPWDKPIEYRLEYLLKNGAEYERDWTATDGPARNLVVTRPNVDQLDITVLPAGVWDDVVQAVVELSYTEGEYVRDAQFAFKSLSEFKQWAVLLRDPRQRKFKYSVTATFKNGDHQDTPMTEAEGDQAIAVRVQGPPRLRVALSGAVIDFTATPLVQVTFEYTDPAGGAPETKSFMLQAKTDAPIWSIPVRADGPRSYRHRIKYFAADGVEIERDWQESSSDVLVVPRYSIARVGAEFNPTLQDFTKTPAIEVEIAYDDPARNVHERASLVFTDKTKQTWYLPVPDEAPRKYTVTITWHFPDGHSQTTGAVTFEKPVVLLPPPRAAQG